MGTELRGQVETLPSIIAWLESLRAYAPVWSHPQDPIIDPGVRFLDVKVLQERSFIAVPFVDHWIPEDTPVFSVLKAQNYGRIYAAGFEMNEEIYRSCLMEEDKINHFLNGYAGFCITAPRNEAVLILHTYSDYWILAGPPDLVKQMVGEPLDTAFDRFLERACGPSQWFEAGKIFGLDIVEKYQAHNRSIMEG